MTFQLIKIASFALLALSVTGCSSRNESSLEQSETAIASKDSGRVSQPSMEEKVPIGPSVMYRSQDGGRTWMSFDNGVPPYATVSSFLVAGDKIFATTDYHGIYTIREGAAEWTRIDADLPADVDINAIAAIGNSLFIGTLGHGMLVSNNNGKNWDRATPQFDKIAIRSLYVNEGLLLAGTDNGIYHSIDNGFTWKHVYKSVQVNGFTELNNNIYAALANGAIATDDNGLHWNYVYEPHTLHDISSDGERLYAMTLGAGLIQSEDGGKSWESVNNGMGAFKFYTFEVKRFGNKIFAAQWHGIYSSDNFGKDWTIIKNGLPDSTAFMTLEVTNSGLIAGIGLRKK